MYLLLAFKLFTKVLRIFFLNYLLNRIQNTQKINFKTFDSFYTSKWRIKNLIWIDNNSIALKVFDNYQGKKLVNVRYLKGEIE